MQVAMNKYRKLVIFFFLIDHMFMDKVCERVTCLICHINFIYACIIVLCRKTHSWIFGECPLCKKYALELIEAKIYDDKSFCKVNQR